MKAFIGCFLLAGLCAARPQYHNSQGQSGQQTQGGLGAGQGQGFTNFGGTGGQSGFQKQGLNNNFFKNQGGVFGDNSGFSNFPNFPNIQGVNTFQSQEQSQGAAANTENLQLAQGTGSVEGSSGTQTKNGLSQGQTNQAVTAEGTNINSGLVGQLNLASGAQKTIGGQKVAVGPNGQQVAVETVGNEQSQSTSGGQTVSNAQIAQGAIQQKTRTVGETSPEGASNLSGSAAQFGGQGVKYASASTSQSSSGTQASGTQKFQSVNPHAGHNHNHHNH